MVLSVGYADLRKGVDLFVSVGAKLIRRDPARALRSGLATWILDWNRSLRAQFHASGLERHFHFPGRDSDTDVYYAGADSVRAHFTRGSVSVGRAWKHSTWACRWSGSPAPVASRNCSGEPADARAGLRRCAFALACGMLLADDAHSAALGGKAMRLSSPSRFLHRLRASTCLAILACRCARVSVVVPNYNYARYLPERLRSIAGQSLPPYEIIVLDDASSDDSLAVLGELARESEVPCASSPTSAIPARYSGNGRREWRARAWRLRLDRRSRRLVRSRFPSHGPGGVPTARRGDELLPVPAD